MCQSLAPMLQSLIAISFVLYVLVDAFVDWRERKRSQAIARRAHERLMVELERHSKLLIEQHEAATRLYFPREPQPSA